MKNNQPPQAARHANHDSAAPRQHLLICTGAKPVHQVHDQPMSRAPELECMYVCNMLLALVPLHVRSQPTTSQDGNVGSRRMQLQGDKLSYRPASVAFTLTFLVSASLCLQLSVSFKGDLHSIL